MSVASNRSLTMAEATRSALYPWCGGPWKSIMQTKTAFLLPARGLLDPYNMYVRHTLTSHLHICSSGAMMTNVLIGSYPDVFAAGSAWAGVPFGCFAGNGFDVWSDACATGQIIKTGPQWAALVRNAYPSYRGFRPKFQTLHGTADTTLYPQNFREQIKQWTSVFDVSQKPTEITENVPFQGWTRFRYGDKFEAYEAGSVTHDIPTDSDTVMDFFDLKCSGPSCFSRPRSGNGTKYHG
jgi:acetylxylan esterase